MVFGYWNLSGYVSVALKILFYQYTYPDELCRIFLKYVGIQYLPKEYYGNPDKSKKYIKKYKKEYEKWEYNSNNGFCETYKILANLYILEEAHENGIDTKKIVEQLRKQDRV